MCVYYSLQSYSTSPCIFSASVICGLYICCTNHLRLLSSSVSFPSSFLSSHLPHSAFLSPHHFPVSVFSSSFLSHILVLCLFTLLLLFLHLLLLLPSPSLHEGLGRASLIGSVWWWRQSDLEWVTDEVRSARSPLLHGCCRCCYCTDLRCSACGNPYTDITYQSPHVNTHAPAHTSR